MHVGQPSDGDHRQMGTEVSPGLKMEIWNSSEFISVQVAAKAKAQEGTLPRRDHESRKEVT